MVHWYFGILTVGVIFFQSPGIFHSQDSVPSMFRSRLWEISSGVIAVGVFAAEAHRDMIKDQRSEPEAESQVRSTSDDILHAVSIPAYKTHHWKEDSCSPNLDGDLAQGTNKI